MKVQLIQPTTGEYRSNSRSGCYAPLGLISMATVLRRESPTTEVEILDGELLSHEEIIGRLDADVVGLSTNTVNYPQAIKVAEAAKREGSRVVLGGVYATAIPDVILQHRRDIVDAIVVGYGEFPLLELVRGKNDALIFDRVRRCDSIPHPDRRLIDLDAYIDRFRASHPTWLHRGANVFTNVGCTWREKTGGCLFCSRSGDFTAFRNPRCIWSEIRELVEDYQVDYVVDFSDTILQDEQWLRRLIETKPPDLNPSWHIFARMDEITPATLLLAKRLPCRHVFVGIESGDPAIYKETNKGGGSPEQALEAARLLTAHGIQLTPSYVIGLPGESEESLARTHEHALRLKDLTSFEEVFCCALIPFPGSTAFRLLAGKQQMRSDILSVDGLKVSWAQHFCKVHYDVIQEFVDRILHLGKYRITISREHAPDERPPILAETASTSTIRGCLTQA